MNDVSSALATHGHVAKLSTLRAAGLHPSEVRRAADRGAIRRLRHGWYATWSADTQQCRAVVLGGRVSCVSALRRYGVWAGMDRRGHVRVPRTASRLRRHAAAAIKGSQHIVKPSAVAAGDEPQLDTHTTQCIHWTNVSNPSRSDWLDDVGTSLRVAVGCQDDEHAVASIDSVIHHGLLEIEEVRRLLDWPRGRRLLAERSPGAESGGESIFSRRMRNLGHDVVNQYSVPGVGRFDGLIDGCLLFEYDGYAYHRSRDSYLSDRDRTLAAQAFGLPCVRITPELLFGRWHSTLAAVERALTDARTVRRHRP